jgi:membrane-associated protein
MLDWLHQLTDPAGLRALLQGAGLLLLIAIIFAETGILAGFFLPGDSLLLTAGVLCALDPTTKPPGPPVLDLFITGAALSVAAIAGDWLNFSLGKWTGNRVWQRPDGRFYKRAYLEEARDFYERWGGWAIAGGRFVPIVRTFVPFVAGMARMPYLKFVFWNVAGALIWVWSMLLIGWKLGQNETMRANLHYLVLAVIAVSFVPVAVGVIRRLRRGPASPAVTPASEVP